MSYFTNLLYNRLIIAFSIRRCQDSPAFRGGFDFDELFTHC